MGHPFKPDRDYQNNAALADVVIAGGLKSLGTWFDSKRRHH